MRYLTLFLTICTHLFSDPYLTAVTENDPSTLVEGVSVITGDFYMGEEDYIVQGAEPIPLRRYYVSRGIGLTDFQHLIATFYLAADRIAVFEPNGTPVTYYADPSNRASYRIGKHFYGKKKNRKFRFHSKNFIKAPGVSNTSSQELTAKTQLKNQTIIFDSHGDPKGKSFTLYAADGTIRRYVNLEKQKEQEIGPGTKGFLLYQYKLMSETLPNGHVLHYEWDHKNRLCSIKSSNLQNTKTFATLSLPRFDIKKPASHLAFHGSDGRSLSYHYQKNHSVQYLTQTVSPEYRKQDFSYTFDHHRALLTDLSLSNRKLLSIAYDKSPEKRVSALYAPTGLNGQMLPIHRFSYQPEKQTSSSFDVDGNKTSYFWNHDLRITRIERYFKDTLHDAETFLWKDANVQAKTFFDENNNPLFLRKFSYDPRGNLVEEVFWGNLSGRGPPIQLNHQELPNDLSEKITISRSYNERNLITKQIEANGLTTTYHYLPHAQLPTAQFTSYDELIFLRKFYQYDSDMLLVREIEDDGSSVNVNDLSDVTVRTIKTVHPKQTQPYIGLPEVIEEKYWDGAKEKLLSKTYLHYTTGANVSQKDIYDANGSFCYSLHYKYDDIGNLIEESNAIGQRALYSYDQVGNLTYQKDFSGHVEIYYTYDLANRPIQKEEIGLNGKRKTFYYSYDAKGNLLSESDEYGNFTYHEYDAFGKCVRTILPSILSTDSRIDNPCLSYDYDCAGNNIKKIDAKGNETNYTYNARGEITSIHYPDGSFEEKIYNLDGTLQCKIDPLGVQTEYAYDALRHLTDKKIFSSQNKLLAHEHYVHKGDLLTLSVDAEGNETRIFYDGAGRKIIEDHSGKRTEYRYDSLGRMCEKIEGDLLTCYTYDFLDQLIEEKKISSSGELLQCSTYEYDDAGNQTAVHDQLDHRQNSTYYSYDSFNRLIEQRDALENITTISYHTIQNSLGQTVLQKKEIDPLGLEIVETYDARGNVVSREIQNFHKEEFFYDLNGNKTLQVDHISTPNRMSRSIKTLWEYDDRDRLISLIEAADTKDSKTTSFSYNQRGDQIAICKPDGVVLHYTYDDLGNLIHLYSSDGSVSHRMQYNKLGELIACDGIQRTLDPHGQILEESFPSGFSLQNRFDERGRKIECQIEEQTIYYHYDPLYLKSVEFDSYVHRYANYDLQGNLLEEELIGGLGHSFYSYDLLQRPISFKAPHFSQAITSYDPVGNIIEMQRQNDSHSYNYDALYQLTKEDDQSYLYDSLYNRLQKNDEEYEINALNQISSFTYDLNGNPTQLDEFILTYDALDRLISIEGEDFVEEFSYDYLNRCLSKTVNGVTSYFLYDDLKEIGSYNDILQLQEFRVLGNSQTAEIGSSVALFLDDKLYVPIHDMQGNVALLLSLDEEVEHYSYSAFGEEKENNTLSPWRFCSKRVDPHTGLVQFGRRFYLPKYGRWLTPDPLGFTSNQNLYAFAHNNALVRLDEYGLFDFEKFKEDTKYAGQYFLSNAIHDTWKAAGTTVALTGELSMTTGRMFLPFTDSPSYDWNNFLESGHHSIDKVFGTNLTGQKLMEQKLPLTMGEMPTPSMFGTASKVRHHIRHFRPYVKSGMNWLAKSISKLKGAFVASKGFLSSKQKTHVRNIINSKALKNLRSSNKKIKSNIIWTSTKRKNSVMNAYDHWKKHGHEFPGILNSKQYVEEAHNFFSNRHMFLKKTRPNGEVLIYDIKSNTFGSFKNNGTPKTIFKPKEKLNYWKRNN